MLHDLLPRAQSQIHSNFLQEQEKEEEREHGKLKNKKREKRRRRRRRRRERNPKETSGSCSFTPFCVATMALSFAPPLSVLAPFLFLSLGSALLLRQLGFCVATMAHSVGQENFAQSLSSPILTYENEVFISFHAEDTHTRFTGHLFAALEHKRIRAYRGEFIQAELMKAIETSRIKVVVFSKNYATSNWCLDELVKIMKCKRVLNQMVLPIFYDVSPSEVRKHKGNLAEAILNGPEDKVNIWKATLKDVANLAGLHLKRHW